MKVLTQSAELTFSGALRLWCARHRKPFLRLRVNMAYAERALLQYWAEHEFEGMSSAEEVQSRFWARVRARRPVCCIVGQRCLDSLLSECPPSSGDLVEDTAAAEQALAQPVYNPYTGVGQ